jgi:hypothetical protein
MKLVRDATVSMVAAEVDMAIEADVADHAVATAGDIAIADTKSG